MTSRSLTIAGFALILAVAAGLDVLARSGRVALPSIEQTLTRVRRSNRGRIVLLCVWFWLGWHFLAR
jgi:uncharacterized protein DUF6186